MLSTHDCAFDRTTVDAHGQLAKRRGIRGLAIWNRGDGIWCCRLRRVRDEPARTFALGVRERRRLQCAQLVILAKREVERREIRADEGCVSTELQCLLEQRRTDTWRPARYEVATECISRRRVARTHLHGSVVQRFG